MTKKSWAFSYLVAAISATLHETFVRNKYASCVSQFLLYLKRFCSTTEGVSTVFLSFLCLWNVPGWGHLITWMDSSVGHLNGILARVVGNLNNNFQKSQMPGALPRGGMLKLWFDRYITWENRNFLLENSNVIYLSLRGRRKKGRGRGREKSTTPLPFSPFLYPLPLSTPATQATFISNGLWCHSVWKAF